MLLSLCGMGELKKAAGNPVEACCLGTEVSFSGYLLIAWFSSNSAQREEHYSKSGNWDGCRFGNGIVEQIDSSLQCAGSTIE